MKFLLAIILSVTGFSGIQAQTKTKIEWESNPRVAGNNIFLTKPQKVAIADFKGVPNRADMSAALTASGFGYGISVSSANGESSIEIEVYCYFSRDQSWMKPAYKTDYILNHEQRHLDITYSFARQFYSELMKLRLVPATAASSVKNLYEVFNKRLSDLQHNYDNATVHGINKAVQDEWNLKIDALPFVRMQ